MSVGLSLPVVAIADLTSPAELFRCAHFAATLSAGTCIARQSLRRKASAAAKDQSEKVPHHLEHCASGKCEQGNAVKAKLADYEPPTGDRAQRIEKWRAQGPARLQKIEQQIAAKVASGELRVAEAVKPAESKKEEIVADKACKEQGCTAPLRSDNESGYCKPHSRKHQARAYRKRQATEKNGIPPAQPVVHDGLLQARERITPSLPDFETMLSERIAYHEGEAARLGRALAALRGAA